jgi:hypothetical protein
VVVSPWLTDVEFLHSNPYLVLKHISCDYLDGVLILRGCLPTYYLKQLAQETVADLDGVDRIDNQIQVVTPTLSVTSGLTVEPSRHENHAVIFALRGVF